MKLNSWTLALASAGVIGSGTALAEEQNQVMTALSQTTLSGYVDTSAIWSVGSPNGTLAGRSFDGTADKLDGFNLHAVKLVLEKPLDEGQWSAGYKADLVFGPDASYYHFVTFQCLFYYVWITHQSDACESLTLSRITISRLE